jgi:hypothetical protein
VRGELDFEAYVAARGATVVRGLQLLGLGLAEAEDGAAEAFAVLRAEWGEVLQTADQDVAAWAIVLSLESRRRRRGHLPPLVESHVARVLRETASLEELQVCEVMGIPVSRLRVLLSDRDYSLSRDDAWDQAVAAVPLPYARVMAASGRRRRRRWLLTGGVASATAVVVGVVALLTRPEPVERPGDLLEPAPVVVATNPAGVVWWADGELHLRDSVVRIGEASRLVAAGTGAAYIDGTGRLVAVTADGERRLLGRPVADSPLVSSPRLGLVAWTEAAPDATRMVVWDVKEDRQVAAVLTRPRTRLITFDGGWLRFGHGLRDWAWDPAGGQAQLTGDGSAEDPNERTALVDAVAGTRLEQLGTYLRVVRSGRRGETIITGFGGSLSADGRLVLTGPDKGREPQLYDARSGNLLRQPLPARHVPAATFAGPDEVVWLVDDRPVKGWLLVTCDTSPPVDCGQFVRLGDPDKVLLAGDSRR